MKRLALIAAAAVTLTLTGCGVSEPPPVSDRVQQVYEEGRKVKPLGTEYPAPQPLALNAESKALFFGDSWTAGVAATPATEGYAYVAGRLLQLDFEVDAKGSGTGYLNVGPIQAGTYNDRLSAYALDPELKLLVLQGGLNDPGAGNSMSQFAEAAAATLATAKAKFPNAQIVLMGPISPVLPVGPDVLSVTASLRSLAEVNGLHFVSGLQEGWLTAGNLDQMIDEDKGRHPNNEGHAYVAQRLVEALRKAAG